MNGVEGLNENGWAVEHVVLDHGEVERFADLASRLLSASSGSPAGIRGLFSAAPEFAVLEGHDRIRSLVDPVLGVGAFVARSILFDKTVEANWDVVWHQDKTIAVNERRDAAGFGPWSIKAGVPHVQPPVEVLAGMMTIRIHLDECGDDNGPLLVIRGSHRRMLTEAEVLATDWDRHPDKSVVRVPRGGAMIMRPLILHASKKAQSPRRRRVVHLEFAAAALPGGLEWARL